MRSTILIVGFVCVSLIALAQSNNSNAQPSKTATHPRDAASGQASGKKMAQDDWHQQSAANSSDAQTKSVSSDSASVGQSKAVRESPSKSSLRESPSKSSLRESPSKSSLRESPSKPSSGLRESPSKATLKLADMDGDGRADKTAASSSQEDSKVPRDSSTGLATSKPQHPVMPPQSVGSQADRESSAPSVSEITVTKPSNAQSRVAAGDVNGDGHADVAATAGSSNSSGQNAAVNNSHSNIKNTRDAGSGQASGKRQHEPIQVKKTTDVASPK